MWTPKPLSHRHFPREMRSLTIDTPDGVVEYQAQQVGAVEVIPDYDDPDLIGTAYLGARHRITEQITQQLELLGMVADVEDYQLTFMVTARVKAWPVVKGITVLVDPDSIGEFPMPIDAS